jgi:predicted GNAT family acetyltransferase
VLDNPIWSSLTGSRHSALAVRDGAAARYRAGVSQLAAVAESSPDALSDLARLVEPGESVLVLDVEDLDPVGPRWTRPVSIPLLQMVIDTPLEASHQDFAILREEDGDDAMALVELTEPGPFLPGTLKLGHYIGLREEGHLVAMAGERMKPEAHTEISAVCIHPQLQGRGLGEALVRAHTSRIQREGLTACLHVAVDNTRAIALYERLGYRARRRLAVSQLLRGEG